MKSTPLKRTPFKKKVRAKFGRKVKTDNQKAEKRCDALWSLLIRKRDPICKFCNKRPSAQAHHAISRRYKHVRYLPENGIGVCKGCHKFNIHNDIPMADKWHREKIGEESYEKLKIMGYMVHKDKVDYAYHEALLNKLLEGYK